MTCTHQDFPNSPTHSNENSSPLSYGLFLLTYSRWSTGPQLEAISPGRLPQPTKEELGALP